MIKIICWTPWSIPWRASRINRLFTSIMWVMHHFHRSFLCINIRGIHITGNEEGSNSTTSMQDQWQCLSFFKANISLKYGIRLKWYSITWVWISHSLWWVYCWWIECVKEDDVITIQKLVVEYGIFKVGLFTSVLPRPKAGPFF